MIIINLISFFYNLNVFFTFFFCVKNFFKKIILFTKTFSLVIFLFSNSVNIGLTQNERLNLKKTNKTFMKIWLRKCCKAGLTLLLALFAVSSFAQQSVTGTVTDAKDGSPLNGATVTVKGTKNVTKTNPQGVYNLSNVAANAVLIITNVGFGNELVSVEGKATVDAKLTAANQNLSEVVVVGYGTQRKKDVTGSIVKIGAEKIANVAAPSFESALAGKAAGVQINTNNGLAGSGASIRIRGIATVNTQSDPLIVIDGLPLNNENGFGNAPSRGSVAQDRNPLSNINPNDIESIEILKDASAAGIYGSRAANGVILITTKKGKGKGKIGFSTRVGVSTPSLKPKFVDKNTWLAMRQEAWENDGNTGLQQNLPGGLTLAQAQSNPNTDWWDLATQTGFNQEYNLNYSIGKKDFSAFVSGGFNKQKGFVIGNDFTRGTINGNFEYKGIKNLTLSARATYGTGVTNTLNNAWNGGIGLAMSTGLPYYPVYNADGSYFRANGGTTWEFFDGGNNLVAQRDLNKFRNRDSRLILGGTASYKINKEFAVTTSVSQETNNSLFSSFNRFVAKNNNSATSRGDSSRTNGTFDKYTAFNWNGNVSYNKQLTKAIKLNALVGAEYQEQEVTSYGISLDTVFKPIYDDKGGRADLFDIRKADASSKDKIGQPHYKLYQSYFTRATLSFFDGRYTLQGSVRRDQSSVFRESNRVAYFPTASAAWTISDEKFMQKQSLFNFLKLRMGWGLIGNDRIPTNAGYSVYDTSRTLANYYGGNPTIFQSNLGNPNLKWETSTELSGALEFGLLKNRISGEVAVYRKTTKDLLLEVPVSFVNGVGEKQWQNQGSVLNQGIEFTLNTVNIQSANFKWTSNFNISRNYNEILDAGNLLPDAIEGGTNETRIVPGFPIGTIYTVRFHGVDPADGSAIYLDRNGNQTKTLNVTAGTGDKVAVGSNLPDFTGGITNTFRYKNLELNTLITYSIGGKIWDNSGKRSMNFISDWNIYSFMVGNYWRKPGDVAQYPRLTLSNQGGVTNPWDNNSTLQVYDASFARLREVSLAYYFPNNWLRKYKISNAKAFISGFNLLLFTKYPVGDPEGGRDSENNAARNQSANANFLNVPLARTISFGLNVTF
jgi:TonB-dependent starch-binding outer membrane protein SusC